MGRLGGSWGSWEPLGSLLEALGWVSAAILAQKLVCLGAILAPLCGSWGHFICKLGFCDPLGSKLDGLGMLFDPRLGGLEAILGILTSENPGINLTFETINKKSKSKS